jgi:energy-coupling factor transport system permease protein
MGALGTLVVAGVLGVPGLQYVLSPLRLPTLPVVAAVGILVGLVPAWAAPVERTSSARGGPTSRPVAGTAPDTGAGPAPDDAVSTVGLPRGNGA